MNWTRDGGTASNGGSLGTIQLTQNNTTTLTTTAQNVPVYTTNPQTLPTTWSGRRVRVVLNRSAASSGLPIEVMLRLNGTTDFPVMSTPGGSTHLTITAAGPWEGWVDLPAMSALTPVVLGCVSTTASVGNNIFYATNLHSV